MLDETAERFGLVRRQALAVGPADAIGGEGDGVVVVALKRWRRRASLECGALGEAHRLGIGRSLSQRRCAASDSLCDRSSGVSRRLVCALRADFATALFDGSKARAVRRGRGSIDRRGCGSGNPRRRALATRRRSRADRPPQMPWSSLMSSAKSRHCRRTGHSAQMACASACDSLGSGKKIRSRSGFGTFRHSAWSTQPSSRTAASCCRR